MPYILQLWCFYCILRMKMSGVCMLIINPTISTNYQAQKNSKTIKKDSKLSQETGQEAKLCLVLGCLATIAAATIGSHWFT